MPELTTRQKKVERKLRRNRWEFLAHISAILELPMVLLALVWLVLIIYDLVTPAAAPLVKNILATIWYLFIGEFILRGLIAPDKVAFLRANWLGALSMLLPALRTLQVFSALSSLQVVAAFSSGNSVALLVLSSINRSMGALHKIMRRRGSSYVAALTVVVMFAGAAGMLATEKNVHAANGIHDFETALYWSFMLLTTIGSEYWPKTPQGKLICMAMSLYAVAILGYIAGTLASLFIGKDAHDEEGDIASDRELRELKKELQQLRSELRSYFAGRSE